MQKIKMKIHSMGIRQKTVSLAMLFFCVVVIVTGVTFFSIYERMRRETIEKTLDSIAIQKKSEIEEYFDNLKDLAYSTGYATWMQTLFQSSVLSDRTMREREENVEYFLGSITEMNADIRIAAILHNGTRLNPSGAGHLDYSIDLQEQSWFPEFLEKGMYIEEGEGKGIYTRGNGWYMNLYYPINNRYTLEREGILVITVDLENMELFANLDIEGGYVVLRNEEGRTLAGDISGDSARSYRTRIETVHIGEMKWSIQAILDGGSMVVDSSNIWIGSTVILMLGGFLFSLAALMFSQYLTVPILKCRDAMIRIRDNHMGIHIYNPYRDEIGELIDGFNEMSGSIHDLIEKNKIISTLQKETEYQMLLQQINPHFLYNTLEIINGLVLEHKDEQAVRVSETLGKIFRYNLRQDKWITVRQEIDHVREYLGIAAYKLVDLEVYYEIDKTVMERKILKGIMQPLVENCIRHGFADKVEDCSISVSIASAGKAFEISIMDNGKGMDRETYLHLLGGLQDIREHPNREHVQSFHIGIRNVFHRLYLEYENNMRFQIMSKEGRGTRIQIELPEEERYV